MGELLTKIFLIWLQKIFNLIIQLKKALTLNLSLSYGDSHLIHRNYG
jgi:hypothetical protein